MRRLVRFVGWMWLPVQWWWRGCYDKDAARTAWAQGWSELLFGQYELRRFDIESGWDVTDRPDLWDDLDLQVACRPKKSKRRLGRPGLTLIELLVCISILSLLITIGGVVMGVSRAQKLKSAANQVESQASMARDRAALAARDDARSKYAGRTVAGFAGIRLLKDRIVPLSPGTPYAEGRASVRFDWPEGFVPPYGRLVLEEALFDEAGLRNNPTSWYWNIRLGDVVNVQGVNYTVCGPMEVANGEGYVNVGNPGASSPLDRGDGPIEFLFLVDGYDDDSDGVVDDGWNGLDEDLDGSVDEPDEWEQERWAYLAASGLTSVGYRIARRPTPDASGESQLPAGIVIDLDACVLPGRPEGWPFDLLFDQMGGVSMASPYATPQRPLGSSIRIRLAEWADEDAYLELHLDMRSGRFEVEERD